MNKRKALAVFLILLGVSLALVSVTWFWKKIEWDSRYRLLWVASGSMNPVMKVGATIVVEKTEDPTRIYAAQKPDGDIIVFTSPRIEGEIIVHRAVYKEYHSGLWYFRTQGDANYGPDNWWGSDTWNGMISENRLVGEVVGINSTFEAFLWGSYLGIIVCLVVGILSVVGGVLVVVIPRGQASKLTGAEVSVAVPSPVTRVCPSCLRNLSGFTDDIILCPYCGKSLK